MLRTQADIARALGVQRQRLTPYMAVANPVSRDGRRMLYDEAGQAEILDRFHHAQCADRTSGNSAREPAERALGLKLYQLARELGFGLLRRWRYRNYRYAPRRSR